MNKITQVLAILSLTFYSVSCDKSPLPAYDTHNSDNETTYIDETGETFAKLLANSLNDNVNLSSYLYAKASERFDGDNNFLIIPALDEPVAKSEHSFKEMLKASCLATRGEGGDNIDVDAIARKLKVESPLLQVYIMNIDAWDVTDKPLVAYIPDDFDDQVVSTISAFDGNGNEILLSSDGKYENQSIIVVSRNERTVAASKDVLGDNIEFKGAMPIHVDEKYNYYLKTDIQYTSDTNPEMASIGDLVIPSEYRQSHRYQVGNEGKDYVYKVRPKNKSAWNKLENPFLGDPELYVNVIYGKFLGGALGSDNVTKMFPTGYKNRNNIKWKVQNVEMLRWDLLENGKSMKYVWAEDDGGSIINIDVQYSIGFLNNQVLNGTFKIGIGKKDERAGESIVYYTDEDEHVYDTGYVLFTIQTRA